MNRNPHHTERVISKPISKGWGTFYIVCPVMPGATMADVKYHVQEQQQLFITSETARALVAELTEHLSLIDNPL